jgi:hypothetical protein
VAARQRIAPARAAPKPRTATRASYRTRTAPRGAAVAPAAPSSSRAPRAAARAGAAPARWRPPGSRRPRPATRSWRRSARSTSSGEAGCRSRTRPRGGRAAWAPALAPAAQLARVARTGATAGRPPLRAPRSAAAALHPARRTPRGRRACARPPRTPGPPIPRARSAERFGTEYRDPGRRREFRLEAMKERLAGEGFATGFDMFSEVCARAGPAAGGLVRGPGAMARRVGMASGSSGGGPRQPLTRAPHPCPRPRPATLGGEGQARGARRQVWAAAGGAACVRARPRGGQKGGARRQVWGRLPPRGRAHGHGCAAGCGAAAGLWGGVAAGLRPRAAQASPRPGAHGRARGLGAVGALAVWGRCPASRRAA